MLILTLSHVLHHVVVNSEMNPDPFNKLLCLWKDLRNAFF